ncbi:MAG: CcmD family protein [Candidatus Promineifilaceae bacterium]|nr:CcmD family protein [Candidatus Promineifilaceae bacterium]
MTELNLLLELLAQTGMDDPNRFNEFLILGYAVMWLTVMVYLAILANRQRNTREEIKLMQRLLEEDEETQN